MKHTVLSMIYTLYMYKGGHKNEVKYSTDILAIASYLLQCSEECAQMLIGHWAHLLRPSSDSDEHSWACKVS